MAETTQSYITAVKFKDDPLWHGALFVNHPTPSGLDRFLLQFSDPTGNRSAKQAVKNIRSIFPDVPCELTKQLKS